MKNPQNVKGLQTGQSDTRRYLVNINTLSTQQLFTDCLVIGSGIAGLRAAIEASAHRNVILVTKKQLKHSNTWNAQGGIASVLKKVDSFEAHATDTLKTGCGLCDEQVVDMVVRKGPALTQQLVDWGTAFDVVDGEIDTTLEGGHSQPRIAHAHGDETGRIIAQALIDKVKKCHNIKIMEHFFSIDLLTDKDDRCVGMIGHGHHHGGFQIIWAANTILATGGIGQLYRETTNPDVATGDGLAMAYRAGATLRDMEMIQFHPTTLYIAGASRALITETLRGEGTHLVDCNGCRFMGQYDPAEELAPRDVVSRSILSQMRKTESTHVYLDIRHFDKAHFKKRFPLISEICENFDIDISQDLIPVRPSAHYMLGGVKTDLQGRTSLKNLLACGEVASTGLHGANRLGSNSLLEGLVFGSICGQTAETSDRPDIASMHHPIIQYTVPNSGRTRLDTVDVFNSLRSLMWRNVGITRTERPLVEAREIIGFWQRYVMDKAFDCPSGWECQNMLTVAMLMAQSATLRQESRGVHYRMDYPKTNDEAFKHHIEMVRHVEGSGVRD